MSWPDIEIRALPGLTGYDEAHALQLDLVDARRRGQAPDTLLLLEHSPVITLGRNASPGGVLADPSELERLGVIVRRVERGGQTTYHGPGQIVGYPILDLRGLRLGVRAYVSRLEDMMIRAAALLGVEARRRPGIVGVFTDRGKIGAVGVRVLGGVTFHGFSFNVHPDLKHYRLIVPCGMSEIPVTSIAASLGREVEMDEARRAVIRGFEEAFGATLTPARPG